MMKSRKTGDDLAEKIHEKMDNLFPERDALPSDMSIHQVEVLKSRVAELEAILVNQQREKDTSRNETESIVKIKPPVKDLAKPDQQSTIGSRFSQTANSAFSAGIDFQHTKYYTFMGIALGFFFPFMGTLINLWIAQRPFTFSNLLFAQRSDPLLWIIDSAPLFLGSLAALAGLRQDCLEGIGRELRERERELGLAQQYLEQRVIEKTHDIELASGVSRAVSEKISDLHVLLKDSVNLIRNRFDLYYTQIYLTDHSGRTLILRAGTGEVGEELFRRSHKLPVGIGSLNGRAAVEKRTVLVADTSENPNFLANPLLPKTRSEMAVPLVAAGKVVGVLDMQSDKPGALNELNLPIFETLAGQLAVALQNAALYAQVQEARLELETQIRGMSEKGWDEFLNAIERGQKMGYTFNQDKVLPLEEESLELQSAENPLEALLQSAGATLGTIQVTNEPTHVWESQDLGVAQAVAAQLAQHIENLRLLAQAKKYREEAEYALRRLTNEGWASYLQGRSAVRQGYAFDLNRVQPLSQSRHNHSTVVKQSLLIRDQTIGELAIDNDGISDSAREILGAVATQLSSHLENLRLMEETQQHSLDLEEAQTFLNSVIENLPSMLFVKDANELRFLRWNKAAEELVGFSQQEMLGKNDYDFFPKEQADFFTSKDRQVLVDGITLDVPEESLATVHQGIRYMHTRKTPIYGVDGKPKYLLGVAEDITEHKRASEALARRAMELASVAQVSTTVSTVLDPDKLLQAVVDFTKEQFGLYHAHIYFLNESWQTLLLAAGAGEAGRQMVAEGWHIPLDHATSIVARVARRRTSVIANDVYHDKNSSFLSNRLLPNTRSEMAVPIIVGETLLGIFDIQSEVVGRFTDEDVNIYTTLAAQVGVALQNARLYVEQAATVTQLRELDKLKSSFLANMSHELRTPLNSILGFSEVMLEGLDGELTEYMDNDLRLIRKNGQHLLHLINDVLDMAKIESGRMNLNPERFRLHDVFEEVTSITSTLANEKNTSLVIDTNSDREIEVYADNTRLCQVMINLVNNAIKFTENGRIVLSAKALLGERVLVTVEDTGIGIPPDKLEAIFQEFTQVDSSTTRKVGGTGLGLPISRRLVEMHGGRLWAESTGTPGEGSIFFVELPLEARLAEVV